MNDERLLEEKQNPDKAGLHILYILHLSIIFISFINLNIFYMYMNTIRANTPVIVAEDLFLFWWLLWPRRPPRPWEGWIAKDLDRSLLTWTWTLPIVVVVDVRYLLPRQRPVKLSISFPNQQ